MRADSGIAMRNFRDPDGPALVYTLSEITAFLAGAKRGESDHLERHPSRRGTEL
ncbi:DUF397 domain-containing protein [Streptomyces sp. NPDC093982]|uniref:DUF397 domain-containing protein n=1 Tax=Streptomyces sp. NPDC093982 TaxID=3155077 RepID=UPI0034170A86